jgi:2-polyprenyl-3-methyl-5-hydroxy-6-metoxy-1,4-benzoquinol methylase
VHAVAGKKVARLSVARAYDAIAAGYDDQVRGDDWMRARLHAQYRRAFRRGGRVLDVGCGTGIDAVFLARMGLEVVGIDASAAMIDVFLGRIGDTSQISARVLRVEDVRLLGDQRFDGLVSAFASLSALPDLRDFADDAARLVTPGGRMILHMLNRFSTWEWLGDVWRGDWHAASRVGRERQRRFVIGGQAVQHSMYFPVQAYRAFHRDFHLRELYSLGALRPPHTVRRLPRALVDALERADLRLGGLPLVRNAGRFFVLDLERRSG